MGICATDEDALQLAIQRAIAKEANQGLPSLETDIVWILRTAMPAIKPYQTCNPGAMLEYIKGLKEIYPNLPLYLFSLKNNANSLQSAVNPQIYKVR